MFLDWFLAFTQTIISSPLRLITAPAFTHCSSSLSMQSPVDCPCLIPRRCNGRAGLSDCSVVVRDQRIGLVLSLYTLTVQNIRDRKVSLDTVYQSTDSVDNKTE